MLGINTQYGPLLLGEMVAHADSGVKSFMALVMPIFVAACTSHLITSPRWISACFPIVAAVLGVLASCELVRSDYSCSTILNAPDMFVWYCRRIN